MPEIDTSLGPALIDLADISLLGGARARGGSRLIVIGGSSTVTWQPNGPRIFTGIYVNEGQTLAISRNGTTYQNILGFGSGVMVGSGQILLFRNLNTSTDVHGEFIGPMNIRTENGETLTVTTGAQAAHFIMFFDFPTEGGTD